MKKNRLWLVRWIVPFLALAPAVAHAIFNEVSLEAGQTNINYPGNGFTYVVQGGTRGIQSLAVNDTDNRLEVGVTANAIFIINNENKSNYTVSNNSCNGAQIVCNSDSSQLTIDCTNSPPDHTIFLTMGGASSCSGNTGGGGSGGGGGGGGGGGAPPPPPPPPPVVVPPPVVPPPVPLALATPATPATPAVPGVSPAVPATPATPAKPAVSAFKFTKALSSGSKSEDVRQLELKLQALGYLASTVVPDTTYDVVTVKAVQAFQKANKLSQVGVVGPLTQAVLNSGKAVSVPAAAPPATPAPAAAGAAVTFKSFLNIGSKSNEVKALQDKLKALGHLDKSIDSSGYFGSKTADAVKKFQSANGISPVGFVGPGTRAVLNK